MAAPNTILQDFTQITRYDIRSYFEQFVFFLQYNQPRILAYYGGETKNVHTDSFNKMNYLIKETKRILEIIERNSNNFSNYKWWLFIEQIEDNLQVLETTKASPKWLRTVETITSFNANPEQEVVLQQGETIEQLSRRKLGFEDWDNDWRNVAERNNIREEDYTPEGGTFLNVSFENTFAPTVEVVVDSLSGENIYGKDIYRVLTFENNDLVVLEPLETFTQSVDILIQLKKEDNPEFPEQGFNPKLVVGSNVNYLNFPTLIRQLTETFRRDDTISSMRVLDYKRDQDAIFITYEVEGRLGDIQQLKTTLT